MSVRGWFTIWGRGWRIRSPIGQNKGSQLKDTESDEAVASTSTWNTTWPDFYFNFKMHIWQNTNILIMSVTFILAGDLQHSKNKYHTFQIPHSSLLCLWHHQNFTNLLKSSKSSALCVGFIKAITDLNSKPSVPTWRQIPGQSSSATSNEDLWFIVFTVIKVHVPRGLLQHYKGQMAGYCICVKCIYSVVFLKLCLNRCFQTLIQTKMQTYIHTDEHTLSVVRVLSYPERAAAKCDPSLGC